MGALSLSAVDHIDENDDSSSYIENVRDITEDFTSK